ncbi:nickel-binding protein [Caulobacter segnis]
MIERDIFPAWTNWTPNSRDRERLRHPTPPWPSWRSRVQWVESFVTKDKTFCVYLAEDEGGDP